jgi:hypothetical protein
VKEVVNLLRRYQEYWEWMGRDEDEEVIKLCRNNY